MLYPNPLPLRVDPDDLNKHFASTAERATVTPPTVKEELFLLFESLLQDSDLPFIFRPVTFGEVLKEIKGFEFLWSR